MIVNIYLLWGALQDVRERKIKDSYLRVGEIVSLLHRGVSLFLGISTFTEWFSGLLPGVILIIVAKLTGEKIGYGDGIVLLILGNLLTYKEVWILLQAALILLMIFSFLLIIGKKADSKCEIPFLPFLWISHTILWGLSYG